MSNLDWSGTIPNPNHFGEILILNPSADVQGIRVDVVRDFDDEFDWIEVTFRFHGCRIEETAPVVKSGFLDSFSGVPTPICVPALPRKGVIPSPNVEVRLPITSDGNPPKGLHVATERLPLRAAPLRCSQELILGRHHTVGHEPFASRNGNGIDLPNEDATLASSGDLEPIDIGLVVTPRHAEDVSHFDVMFVVHRRDRIAQVIPGCQGVTSKIRIQLLAAILRIQIP